LAEGFADPGIPCAPYYAPETRPIAERLRAAIGENFPQARIGSWHDEPVGLHPVAMYQVAFAVEDFRRLVPLGSERRLELLLRLHPSLHSGPETGFASPALCSGHRGCPVRQRSGGRAPAAGCSDRAWFGHHHLGGKGVDCHRAQPPQLREN
jgi:hypothetical protein